MEKYTIDIILIFRQSQEFISKQTYLLSIFATHSMFDAQLQSGPTIKYLLHNFLEVLRFCWLHIWYKIVLNIYTLSQAKSISKQILMFIYALPSLCCQTWNDSRPTCVVSFFFLSFPRNRSTRWRIIEIQVIDGPMLYKNASCQCLGWRSIFSVV